MTPKHTPGPWIAGWSGDPDAEGKDAAGPLNIVSVGRGGVAECRPIPSGHASTWEVVEVNARLIAKAPELYDMLQNLQHSLDAIANGDWDERAADREEHCADLAMEARALLAEIDGKE